MQVAGRKVRLFGVDAPEKAQACKDARGASYMCGMTACLPSAPLLLTDDYKHWPSISAPGGAGKSAADLLASKLQNVPVACTVKDKDQYGREVASCQAKGIGDIGQFMVSEGQAVAYRCPMRSSCLFPRLWTQDVLRHCPVPHAGSSQSSTSLQKTQPIAAARASGRASFRCLLSGASKTEVRDKVCKPATIG